MARVPIVYGEDVRDWWFQQEEPLTATRSRLAWTGTNQSSENRGMSLRLYLSTWDNPTPEKVIEQIDYASTLSNCAPFLIALTAESPDFSRAHEPGQQPTRRAPHPTLENRVPAERLAFDVRGRPQGEIWGIETADFPVLVSELPAPPSRSEPSLAPATATRLPPAAAPEEP